MTIRRSIRSFPFFLYTFSVILLFITVADQPLRRMGYLPLNPTTCALLLLVPFALRAFSLDIAAKRNVNFLGSLRANAAPLGSLFTVSLVSLLGSILPGSYWEEDGKWIFLIVYGFLIALAATFIPRDSKFVLRFPYIAICALALLLWSIITDVNYPGTFAEIDARAAGFPGNANYSALVAVMICASALDYTCLGRMWRNVVLLIITAAIVVISMSRSGALNYAFLIGIFLWTRLSAHRWSAKEILRLLTISTVTTAVCVGVAIATSLTSDVSRQSRLYRLMNNQQVDDGSAASRLFAVKESLRLINEAPLLGHGTGHSRTMLELPHNLYLQQWVNNGILGILSLLLFFAVTLYFFSRKRHSSGQALILVAILGGVFSHNILDQRPFLILLGIQLGIVYHAAKPAMVR